MLWNELKGLIIIPDPFHQRCERGVGTLSIKFHCGAIVIRSISKHIYVYCLSPAPSIEPECTAVQMKRKNKEGGMEGLD